MPQSAPFRPWGRWEGGALLISGVLRAGEGEKHIFAVGQAREEEQAEHRTAGGGNGIVFVIDGAVGRGRGRRDTTRERETLDPLLKPLAYCPNVRSFSSVSLLPIPFLLCKRPAHDCPNVLPEIIPSSERPISLVKR